MDCVSNTRHPKPRNAVRGISAVADSAAAGSTQPGLWDGSEPGQLAPLGQAPTETGTSDEVLRLIASAADMDDAMEQLIAAGLLPSVEESRAGLISWFTQLLEPGCDRLDAELVGSSFLAAMRAAGPAESDADLADMLRELILQLQDDQSPEVLAMMRVLAAVGPAEISSVATEAADMRVAAGLADFPWAAGLGSPEPGLCFGYGDDFGEQQAIVMCFKYGRKPHSVGVLIDNVLGGGIKDCWISDRTPDSIRNRCRAASRQPGVTFFDLGGAQARAIVEQALSRNPCPVEPDQIEDVAETLDLLRARLTLLPVPAADSAPEPMLKVSALPAKGRAVRKAPASTSVHRVKVTLRGTKPPIWRRFEVPSDLTLSKLHGVIQDGFGWEGDHMWVFETPSGRFGVPRADLGFGSAASKKLCSVAATRGDRIRYEYDFGDCWEHDIVVEAVHPASPGLAYPRCTAGKLAGPPEDCGGIWGYYSLLEILADPSCDEHADRLEWLGLESPADFDPDRFDQNAVNQALARTAKVLVQRVEEFL
jgi:hypothetical protein